MLKCKECGSKMIIEQGAGFYICSNCKRYPTGTRACDTNYEGTLHPFCNLKCNGYCIIKCNESR